MFNTINCPVRCVRLCLSDFSHALAIYARTEKESAQLFAPCRRADRSKTAAWHANTTQVIRQPTMLRHSFMLSARARHIFMLSAAPADIRHSTKCARAVAVRFEPPREELIYLTHNTHATNTTQIHRTSARARRHVTHRHTAGGSSLRSRAAQ